MRTTKSILEKQIEYPFNEWLQDKTVRNSLLTWTYNGKVYKGLDSLRRIWLIQLRYKTYKPKPKRKPTKPSITIYCGTEDYPKWQELFKNVK